jgi:hypothetical protein
MQRSGPAKLQKESAAKPTRDELEEWALKSGHALELRAARALQKLGLRDVGVSEYYRDPTDPVDRECDVVGSFDIGSSSTVDLPGGIPPPFRCTFVVECKYIKQSPWVVFLSGREVTAEVFFRSYPTNRAARIVTDSMGHLSASPDLTVPPVTMELGHRIAPFDSKAENIRPKAEDSKGRPDKANVPFHAVQSAIRAARARIKADDPGDGAPRKPEIAIPVVAVDGELYDCSMSEKGRLRFRSSSGLLLLRTSWEDGYSRTLVPVVPIKSISLVVGLVVLGFSAMLGFPEQDQAPLTGGLADAPP